ncbi:MAG: tryptophan 7-halogenase, partial [Acetobacteraceae bacterium]|nr:tryptophan 7-halogenase [Acetobacteraceae bacterium]
MALRLAYLGRTVALVEKAVFPRPHIGESLGAGVLPLLDVIGLRTAVERADFVPMSGTTVSWAGEMFHSETVGGYQVDRGRFDTVLLDAARHAGVIVRQPDCIIRADFCENQWCLTLRSGGTLEARYLADAGGRGARALLEPANQKTALGNPTLAMFAYWRGVNVTSAETLIEAGRNHWYWGAPLPDGSFVGCVFVDPLVARDTTQYHDLLAESALIGPRLAVSGCSLDGEIRVCDATAYLENVPITARLLRAGDAVLSLDPLSSQGVQVAMGTAVHAATVIHTMFDKPERAELAMKFYHQRVQDSAQYHRTTAADYYTRQWESVGG